MATITFKENEIHTLADLPSIGVQAPSFALVDKELKERSLKDFAGKKKLLNIFPSLDTKICALSVERFYRELADDNSVIVLNISCDLPFAQGRFCVERQLKQAVTLSAFRSTFGKDYGVTIQDGPLKGLLSRAVIVLDANDRVVYTEQVAEITHEPDYQKALEILKGY